MHGYLSPQTVMQLIFNEVTPAGPSVSATRRYAKWYLTSHLSEPALPNTLEATVDISASPEQVWRILSDLKRMPEFSPTTKRMIPLGRPGAGTWTININRVEGKYTYPSTSRIMTFEPNRAFAFRMNENRTVWSYTLEPIETGTRLIERRDIPNGVRGVVRMLVDNFLGGEEQFEADLVTGMHETLKRIKATAER
jgi:uncharacterized protein YndB with AHSA1/START domain